MKEQIQKAIGAHALWKGRLRAAVEKGRSDITVAEAAADNQCEFGKWLYQFAAPDPQSKAHQERVRRLHADFHRQVGGILAQALKGNRDEAVRAMESGPYIASSASLTAEMMDWVKSA